MAAQHSHTLRSGKIINMNVASTRLTPAGPTWSSKLRNGLQRHRRSAGTTSNGTHSTNRVQKPRKSKGNAKSRVVAAATAAAAAAANAAHGIGALSLQIPGSVVHKDKTPSSLTDEDVANAIGTFWIGLARQNSVFGYGSATLFTAHQRPSGGLRVAGTITRSQTFIMPLLFTGDTKEIQAEISRDRKEPKGVGHFLLAVSSQDPEDPLKITTTIMDSLPSAMQGQHDTIRQAYQDLVTYGGWLGVDASGTPLPVAPNFAVSDVRDVPDQQGHNTCGIYTILNAWAVLLGIPIIENRRRGTPRWRAYKEFHATAIEIINLAWAGHMDSETVQAFLNVYGYASQNIREEENKPFDQQVKRVNAVWMDETTLQEDIAVQWQMDMLPS